MLEERRWCRETEFYLKSSSYRNIITEFTEHIKMPLQNVLQWRHPVSSLHSSTLQMWTKRFRFQLRFYWNPEFKCSLLWNISNKNILKWIGKILFIECLLVSYFTECVSKSITKNENMDNKIKGIRKEAEVSLHESDHWSVHSQRCCSFLNFSVKSVTCSKSCESNNTKERSN